MISSESSRGSTGETRAEVQKEWVLVSVLFGVSFNPMELIFKSSVPLIREVPFELNFYIQNQLRTEANDKDRTKTTGYRSVVSESIRSEKNNSQSKTLRPKSGHLGDAWRFLRNVFWVASPKYNRKERRTIEKRNRVDLHSNCE